jgi:hypothetical protein
VRFFFLGCQKIFKKYSPFPTAPKNDHPLPNPTFLPKKIKVAGKEFHPGTSLWIKVEKQHFYSEHTSSLPFFLFVGSILPSKNVQRLVEAYFFIY